MKHRYKRATVLASLAVSSLLFMNYSSGPGGSSQRVTGAPFDNGTCNSCHSGGNYSASVTPALYQGANQVTSYIPGNSYTLRLTRSATGVPVNGGWGFQMTCAKIPTANTNINGWGTLPANTILRSITYNPGGGNITRNYVEHNTKLSNGTTQLDIPWTAPAAGNGSVRFYVALNTVNGNGGTNGDQVVSNTLTITESTLPLTWLYFTGREDKGNVALEWGVASEHDNDYYTIERSEDGKNFRAIGKVNASVTQESSKTYSFVDENPLSLNYYRISQTDKGGMQSYFKTIEVLTNNTPKAPYHTVSASNVSVHITCGEARNGLLKIHSLDGKLVSSASVSLAEGMNSVQMLRPETPGIYIISLEVAGKTVYNNRLSTM